jgi:hypothetical protein
MTTAATFLAYLRERFRPTVFGPAAALLTAAGLWAVDRVPSPVTIAGSAGFLVLLLLAFRLWDDLEDRDRDSRLHRGRVLVQSSPAPFWRALALLSVAAVALPIVASRPLAASGAVLLLAAGWIAYRTLRPHVPERAWSQQVVLLKYPAFVCLVTAFAGVPRPSRLWLAALVAYVGACAYEFAHAKRASQGATP